MWILGIDSGSKGAFVWVNFEDQCLRIWDIALNKDGVMCEVPQLTAHDTRRIIEKVWGRPGQSSTTGFKQGSTYGQCCLVGNRFNDLLYVAPLAWKRKLGLLRPGGTISEKKNASVEFVMKHFPWTKEWIHLKKHDGRADAFCIAYYQHLEDGGESYHEG